MGIYSEQAERMRNYKKPTAEILAARRAALDRFPEDIALKILAIMTAKDADDAAEKEEWDAMTESKLREYDVYPDRYEPAFEYFGHWDY